MNRKPILIHTNFHRKRTGVTRSIENVFPFLEARYDALIFGYGIQGPKISLRQMLELVFSRRYFVLHCHRNIEILWILFFRLIGGNFKLVSTRHAEAPPSSLTEYLLKRSDTVVTLTPSMAEELNFTSVVIGHGVDQNLFKPQKGAVRAEITQKNLLTCAGRVRAAKGQKVLIETISPILKSYKDWALVIVGKVDNPAFLKELEKIVQQNSVKNQVYFIPETADIVSFYQASHSVIVPSFSEGFSMVCAEAMSCECNVIASRGVGVHSDMITDGENGYLFDVHNARELQSLFTKLCKGELVHLGRNARKVISEHWSSKIEAEKLMEIYDPIQAVLINEF